MNVRLLDAGGPVTKSAHGFGSDGRPASCIEQPPASPTGAAARPLVGGCSPLRLAISRAHRAWQKTQPQYAFDLED